MLSASFEMRKILFDYVDCIIVGTGVALKEDVISEDSRILKIREEIQTQFGITIHSISEIVK
ncbi:MAG: hypothetical protein ACYC7D_13175 [Nitrososphaerales archaeon]